ncbi:SIMPL domain-containing protein [Legionella israelensis]|uniref:SIMPL domain-containing protein n=1 Tax=Legionella israelensis TaxID=454 RepID=UPI00117DDA14|nr:SIMPL domain-containing protein [Legionella israelensis]QDP71670.1 SIMPL domain-containing protein [Legionella israelensis]
MMSGKMIVASLLLALGFAASGFFISSGLVESRKELRYVSVKGLAERVVKADQALWTINFKLVNNELPALYQAIEDAQAKVKQFLLKQGFKENEISNNPISVNDNQSNSYNPQNQNLPRYTADAGITVSTKRVDMIQTTEEKTGDLVAQGVVVTSSNAIYRFNGLNDIKPAMLDEATASAHTAAQSFAHHAKAKLGYIRKALQGLFTISDANSTYDSGNAIMKKVRVVTTVEYQLQ